MRYNHFTYVDREIAYFDLLDMSYQVFSNFERLKMHDLQYFIFSPDPILIFSKSPFKCRLDISLVNKGN